MSQPPSIPPNQSNEAAIEKHDPYAAFRYGAYRAFAASFGLTAISYQVISSTVQWTIYNQTKDNAMLAWIAGVQAIPVLLLSLPAGQIADIFPRKKIMITCLFITLISSSVMVYLACAGQLSHYAVYVVLLINAVFGTLGRPARSAMMPAMVPQKVFPNAVTWNTTMFETIGVLSPGLAGMIIAYYNSSAALVFALVCMTFGFVLTFLLPDVQTSQKKEPVTFKQFLAGVRFVFKTRLMLAAMSLDLFAVLLGGATYLLPTFAERLGVGALGYGWLRAAPPIGAIMMALTISHMPPMKHAGRMLLFAVAGFGVATIVFGLSEYYWLSFVALMVCGMCDNISVVIRHTLVQTLTPDSMRGRVSAVNQIFIGSSNEIGGVESTLAAKLFGPVISVVGGGIGTILVVLSINQLFPQVRKLGALSEIKPQEQAELQKELESRSDS